MLTQMLMNAASQTLVNQTPSVKTWKEATNVNARTDTQRIMDSAGVSN